MAKPRLLDLFCGVGGAAAGYARAGFEITGIDIVDQPHYPFKFIHGDALSYPLEGYDVIHASPPCQAYSVTEGLHPGYKYPDLLPAVRERLLRQPAAWAIENVPGAPMRRDIRLCGQQFGLPLYRHRLFELSWPAPERQIPHPRHYLRSTASGGPGAPIITVAGRTGSRADYARALGIDWPASRVELAQAIPPAYTEYLGRCWLEWRNG